MNHYNNVDVNPIDPNPAISARAVFSNPAISAWKNNRFFHIFPNFPKENLPESIYRIYVQFIKLKLMKFPILMQKELGFKHDRFAPIIFRFHISFHDS